MATLRDIRTRIIGVQNTQKITKAMKMVAAAKLRRAQEGIINARPYAKKISAILNHLVTDEHRQANPYLQPRPEQKILLLVVTADRGLCGTFNTNIIKEAQKMADSEIKNGKDVTLFCIGKKGDEYFKKRKYQVAHERTGLSSVLRFESAVSIADEVIEAFLTGTYDVVRIIYNEFRSIVSQEVVVQQYLPIPAEQNATTAHSAHYIYEHNQESIFKYTLPKYLRAQMWKVLLESNASELGAKMTAMDNATTNAGELIRSLRVKYNKERQAAITKEILEIVSGANALKKSGK